ncbi:MAG: hypothetical protein E7633_08655 [Ruminococcaceae bacterium]|nr:hypothetical protein [Oscillospiraceae bacterium]
MITKNTRYFAMIALVCLLITTFTFLLPISAEDAIVEEEENVVMSTSEILATYLTAEYESREEKLATMTYKKSSPNGDYKLYIDSYSGEIAVECVSTGQILLSNPHDVSKVSVSSVKQELLSQIVIRFKDLENEGIGRTFYSYTESAVYGQIAVKNIKNGIRVEYTLGKESSRSLVPRWIEATRFEQMLLAFMEAEIDKTDPDYQKKDPNYYAWKQFSSNYTLIDPNANEALSTIESYYKTYPCTNTEYYKEEVTIGAWDEAGLYMNTLGPDLTSTVTKQPKNKMAIYVINTQAETSEKTLNTLEGYIKKYAPHYNYEEVAFDHELTGYQGLANANAVFYVAVEYQITDEGLVATIPANSVAFDEEAYQLQNITLLPYMGASSGEDEGYTFVPDGSGTIIRNKDINAVGSAYTLSGQVYGADYGYHQLAFEKGKYDGKSAVFTAPVFGVVSDNKKVEKGEIISITEEVIYEKDADGNLVIDMFGNPIPYPILSTDGKQMYYPDGNLVSEAETIIVYEEIVTVAPEGMFAIITEGEALAYITSDHGAGVRHPYNSTYATFYPRSTDTYNLGDSISGAGDTEWTITSDRKYTGSFEVKYMLLSDNENSAYKASYVGMADAYRTHLVNAGIINAITEAADSIPLYLETFGMIEVQEIIMTVPTWVDTPLSTFDDVKTMYELLGESEINNIKIKLTGFTEGGWMYTLAPTTVKFEKVLGGNDGYNDLVAYAEKTDGLLEVFPEFDFANINSTKFFDKYSHMSDSLKTVDDRYTGKRAYSSVYQSFQYVGSTCVSPSAYNKMYDYFSKAMSKFSKGNVSVSTLGSDLSTDFNEDNPLSREDSKEYTKEILSKLDNDFNSVMVSQGNAYTWKYVDHILDIALDGSNYLRSSESVPFLGMVLHGYISFAGSPTNMQGDINYEILKIIENGASPYYILVMQNSSELKEDSFYSDYYSIDFKNWYADIVETYGIINEALHDLQTETIKSHDFVVGTRVLDEDEQKFQLAEYDRQYSEYSAKREEALAVYLKKVAFAESQKLEAEAAGIEYTGEEIEPFEYEEFVYDNPMDIEIDDGSIVYMTYSNGVSFILNYNAFDVTVVIDGATYEVGAFSFGKYYPATTPAN